MQRFGKKKFTENVARDQHTEQELREFGWNVIVVWECETKSIEKQTAMFAKICNAGTFRDNEEVNERAMDSNDIERERGITILAKTSS